MEAFSLELCEDMLLSVVPSQANQLLLDLEKEVRKSIQGNYGSSESLTSLWNATMDEVAPCRSPSSCSIRLRVIGAINCFCVVSVQVLRIQELHRLWQLPLLRSTRRKCLSEPVLQRYHVHGRVPQERRRRLGMIQSHSSFASLRASVRGLTERWSPNKFPSPASRWLTAALTSCCSW